MSMSTSSVNYWAVEKKICQMKQKMGKQCDQCGPGLEADCYKTVVGCKPRNLAQPIMRFLLRGLYETVSDVKTPLDGCTYPNEKSLGTNLAMF